MLINRVTPDLVNTKRVDPDYYAPQYIEDEAVLRAFGSEPLGKTGKFFVEPFGSKLPSHLYLDKGIPLFRVGNVGSMEILWGGMAYLEPSVHSELASSEVRPGDLLIVKASVGEKICKIPVEISKANITQHIIAIRPNDSVDSDFITAFLFGTYGRRQLMRRSLGSIIQYLGVTDARDVLLPSIKRKAQTYIGDKVRQAEKLRSKARKLEKEIQEFFSLSILLEEEKFGAIRVYRAQLAHLSPSRLDAAFYDPFYVNLDQAMQKDFAVPISTFSKQVNNIWNKEKEKILYFEIGDIDIASGTIKPSIVNAVEAPSRAQQLVQPWDVLISTVRPNRKNIAIVDDSQSNWPLVASTGFSVLRFSSKEHAIFFHSWFRSDVATHQLMRWNAGSSYPAIDDSIAINVLVPPFPELTIEEKGKKWSFKFSALRTSENLTITAQFLIEALIEQKITEQDLIDAQEALEKGDNSLDRALLARLTTKGMDVPNASPLFADLDALYEALSLDGEETLERERR